MWENKTKNGKVQFIERYRNPLTGKTATVCTTANKSTNATRKAAEAILQRKIAERLAGTQTDIKEYTLADIADAYLISQKTRIKPSTLDVCKRMTRLIVRCIGPDVRASKLTAAVIRKALPDEPSKYNLYLRQIKAMLRWAYESDMVDDIRYLDKLKPLKDDRKARIADKYLSRAEIDRLLAGMDNPRWRLLTEFLILTGLRIGEAIALEKQDVDLDQRVIHITKTYAHMMAHPQTMPTPKTQSSLRDISIQDELVPVIHEISLLMDSDSPLLFTGDSGGHIGYGAYKQYLEEHTIKDVGRKLTPHALRHTMTSLMAAEGVPLEVISRRLGHESSEITKQVYLHATEDLKKADAKAVRKVKLI
ncbi:MAG: tyrosine-type recombinase/integrase [Eubacterium sp.]